MMTFPRPAGLSPGTVLMIGMMAILMPVACSPASTRAPVEGTNPADESLAGLVTQVLEEEESSQGAYRKLAYLSDRIGPRLSGSPPAAAGVEWALGEFQRDGLDRARTEKFMAPHWIRGVETAEIVSPVRFPLVLTTLGMSVPTPPEGITAPVVEVDSFDALLALGNEVRGKIVFYNKPIEADVEGAGYGSAIELRVKGPSKAAGQGAVAMLIRSLGTLSARLPHTGSLQYAEDAPKIPAAALAAEDAEHLHRLLESGDPVVVRLALGCETLPDAESANVIAELTGHSLPEEVVVIGGHLDSWDVGTGTIDDGAGVVIAMEALRVLKKLDRIPRRTIRAVLFMNEENGNGGGKTYLADHLDEMEKHVAAIESDSGAGAPLGFEIQGGPGASDIVRGLASHLRSLGADMVHVSQGGGTDINPMRAAGVPLLGLRHDMTEYFHWHHTEGDTLDKVDREELIHGVVAMTLMAYALADLPEPLPRIPPGERKPPAY